MALEDAVKATKERYLQVKSIRDRLTAQYAKLDIESKAADAELQRLDLALTELYVLTKIDLGKERDPAVVAEEPAEAAQPVVE